MKGYLRIILLTSILILTSCSNGRATLHSSNKSANKGASIYNPIKGFDRQDDKYKYIYSEDLIYTSEDNTRISNIIKYAEGEFLAVFTDTEDATSELVKLDKNFNIISLFGNDIMKIEGFYTLAIDNLKNIYIINYVKKDKFTPALSTGRTINVYDSAGEFIKEIKIDDAESISDGNFIWKISIRDSRIYLISDHGIQIIGMDGHTLCEIAVTIIDADVLNDGSVILINRDKNCRERVAPDTGDIIWSLAGEALSDNGIMIWHDEKNKKYFYTLSSNYIKKYNYNGEFIENIIDFNLYNIGLYRAENRGIFDIILNNESFYIIMPLMDDTTKIAVYEVKLLEGIEAENKRNDLESQYSKRKNINILIPNRDLRLGKYAVKYQQKNNVNINIIYYRDELLQKKLMEDYTQYINLQIMSGVDWDILSMMLIPYETYARKGVFADLEDITNKNEFSSDEYFQNILDACRIDRSLYMLPADFTVNVLAVNKNYLVDYELNSINSNMTWNDLIKCLNKVISTNSNVKPFTNKDKSRIDSNLLLGLPKSTLDIENNKINFNNKNFYCYLDIVKLLTTETYYDEKITNASVFTMEYLSASNITNLLNTHDVMPFPKLDDTNTRPFILQNGYAINNKSNNKELSLSFIKYLAENSFHLSAYKPTFQTVLNKLTGSDNKMHTTIKNITNIIESLNSFYNHNIFEFNIVNIISKEVDRYRKGNILKEQFANELQEKVWLYLNE